MRMRFRVRTRDGRELTPGSLEAFAQLVHDRQITQYDLVYDALSGEWAPAQTHPVYRMVLANLVEDPERSLHRESVSPVAPTAAPETAAQQPASGEVRAFRAADRRQQEEATPVERQESSVGGSGSFGLSLAPEVPGPSVEEESANFIAEMEAEKAADPDHRAALTELPLVDERSGMAPVDTPAAPVAQPKRTAGPQGLKGEPKRSGGRALWMLAASTLVLATLTSPPPLFMRGSGAPMADSSLDRPSVLPVPTQVETESRERAAELLSVRAAGLVDALSLPGIPNIWLDGRYFAGAVDYPEVRDVWEQYLKLIWSVRGDEVDMYRAAYLDVMDDEGVVGPLRTMRLTGAIPAFELGRARRFEAYRRVEELAAAALSLHDLLVHLDGSILYEPARGPVLSADPLLEAVGKDEESQVRLESALDRIAKAMYAEGVGPVERAQVKAWVRRTIGDAITG